MLDSIALSYWKTLTRPLWTQKESLCSRCFNSVIDMWLKMVSCKYCFLSEWFDQSVYSYNCILDYTSSNYHVSYYYERVLQQKWQI